MLEYITELPIFMLMLSFFVFEYIFFSICKIFDNIEFNYNGSTFFTNINIGIFIIAAFGLFAHFHGLDCGLLLIVDELGI